MKTSRIALGSRVAPALRGGAAMFAAAAALAIAQRASAQECSADSDCRPGYVCKTEVGQSCSGTRPPEACPPGEMCPVGGSPSDEPIVCEPFEYSYCTSAPCASDSECPSDMVCYAQPYVECTAGSAGSGGFGGVGGSAGAVAPPCGPDEMCPDGGGYECVERPGDPVCTPRHVPPCHADADCGPGFFCKEQIGYECSGGGTAGIGAGGMTGEGGSAGAASGGAGGDVGGGDEMKPDDYTCTEVPTGQFYCELQNIACEADADCPGSMRCQLSWGYTCSGSAGSGGGVATGGIGAPTPMTPPGDSGEDDPADEPDGGSAGSGDVTCERFESRSCVPEDWYYDPGVPGEGGAGQGGATGGGTTPPGMMPGSGDGPSEPGSAGQASGGGGRGGTGGGSDDNADEDEESDEHHHGGLIGRLLGCSVAGEDATDATWNLLGLIGFAALVLRRRARHMT